MRLIQITPSILALASPSIQPSDAFALPTHFLFKSGPYALSPQSPRQLSGQPSDQPSSRLDSYNSVSMAAPSPHSSSHLLNDLTSPDPYFKSLRESIEDISSDFSSIDLMRQSLLEKSYAELPLQPNCQNDLISFFERYDEAYRFKGFHNRLSIVEPKLSDTLIKLFSEIVGEKESKTITTDILIRSFMNKSPSSQAWHADLGRIQLRTIIPLIGESTQFSEPCVSNQYLTREPLVKGLPDSEYVGTIPTEQIRCIPDNTALLYTTEYDDNKVGFLADCHPLPHRTPPTPKTSRDEALKRAFLIIDFI